MLKNLIFVVLQIEYLIAIWYVQTSGGCCWPAREESGQLTSLPQLPYPVSLV